MANPAIVVEFLANTSQLKRGIKDAQGSTSRFGSTLKTLGKTGALAAGAAGVGALAYTLKVGIGEYAETQKVAAQTNAVIESTGSAANVTARHVSTLAESLMKKSGVDDEAIASGENLLLTFTNIRNEAGKGNDVFDQTTKAALDMSTALGTDVTSAAQTLGKALNDPAKGMTRLQRSGVTFTDSQKELVKSLQASGDTLGAQKVILQEVNKEFGGSAEAVGKTLPGQINIAKETFNNLAGDLVTKLIPVIQDIVGFIRQHWPEISATIKQAWERDIKPTFQALGALIVSIVKLIRDNWDTIGPIVAAVAGIIESRIRMIQNIIKLFAAILRGDWSAAWDALKGIADAALDSVLGILKLAAAVGGLLVKAAHAIGVALLNGVVAGLQGIGNAAWGVIDNIGTVISTQAGNIASWGSRVASGIKNSVVSGLAGIGTDAWNVINNIGTVIAKEASAIAGWGADIATKIVNAFVSTLGSIGGRITSAFKAPINAVLSSFNALSIPGFTINMPKPIPDVHFGGVGFPDIPLLAKGGIVTRPTLAMVGEAGPEAVIPLGSSGAPIEVRVFIGDQELRGMVRSEVRSENNRTAQTLLAGMA